MKPLFVNKDEFKLAFQDWKLAMPCGNCVQPNNFSSIFIIHRSGEFSLKNNSLWIFFSKTNLENRETCNEILMWCCGSLCLLIKLLIPLILRGWISESIDFFGKKLCQNESVGTVNREVEFANVQFFMFILGYGYNSY
jgi:hypothetical protein